MTVGGITANSDTCLVYRIGSKGRAFDSPFAFPSRDGLHPDNPPDIQRGGQGEYEGGKQDRRTGPFKLSMFPV